MPISTDGHWLDLARGRQRDGARGSPTRISNAARHGSLLEPARQRDLRDLLEARSTIGCKAAGAMFHPWSVEALRRDDRPDRTKCSCAWSRASTTRPRTSTASRRALSRRERKGAPKGAPFVVEGRRVRRRPWTRPAWPCRCGAVRDLDLAGLGGLGDLADEVDMEEAVLQARALHLDMVGELEAALEGARGDAAIKDLAGSWARSLSSRP